MAYKNILNEIIYEELSISGDVQKASIDVWNQILEELPSIKTYKVKDCPGVKKGDGTFSTIIYGERVRIFINLYKFASKKAFETYEDDVDYIGASCIYNKVFKWVTINIPMISGQIAFMNDVRDEIQHELEHLYQGKHGASGISDSDDVYNRARDLAIHPSEKVALIARAIYISYDYEQDAYVNGLYAYLMGLEEPMPKIKWDVIQKTGAYCLLSQLRRALELLENPTNEVKSICLTYFKKAPYILYKIGKSAEFRFVRKIGKVLAKYHKDIREKYNIQEHSFTKIKPYYFC